MSVVVNNIINILNDNMGIVTYAILFETFDRFKGEKPYICNIYEIPK